MQFISASLGVKCAFCHLEPKMELDDLKPIHYYRHRYRKQRRQQGQLVQVELREAAPAKPDRQDFTLVLAKQRRIEMT